MRQAFLLLLIILLIVPFAAGNEKKLKVMKGEIIGYRILWPESDARNLNVEWFVWHTKRERSYSIITDSWSTFFFWRLRPERNVKIYYPAKRKFKLYRFDHVEPIKAINWRMIKFSE